MNMQFIKVLKYSIIDGADNIENVCSMDNCLQPNCMNLYHLLSPLKQFIIVLKNSIIDCADKIKNVSSINLTHWISRRMTVCSPPV